MGLNLAQVYFRGLDLGAFSRTIGPAWASAIASDTKNPRRQMLALLTKTGWVTLVDSSTLLPRDILRTVCGAAGGEGIWISVGASILRYSVLHLVDGEPVLDAIHPPHDGAKVMPLYIDAEMEAWQRLRDLGVPPELRLLRMGDVKPSRIPQGRKANAILFERPALDKSVRHAYFRYAIPEPRAEDDGPPAEFTIFMAEGKLKMDIYIVCGQPSNERVDHLFGVLDLIARRKVGASPGNYTVTVTVESATRAEMEAAKELLKRRFVELRKTRSFSYRLAET